MYVVFGRKVNWVFSLTFLTQWFRVSKVAFRTQHICKPGPGQFGHLGQPGHTPFEYLCFFGILKRMSRKLVLRVQALTELVKLLLKADLL